MDPILEILLTTFETMRADGKEMSLHLTVVSGGTLFAGKLITYSEFIEASGEGMGAVASGIEEVSHILALREGESLKGDHIRGFLHLDVTERLSGGAREKTTPTMPMRFPLEALAAWSAYTPAPD